MKNIFGRIKDSLGVSVNEIRFPCTFYCISEHRVVFAQHQNAGYVQISLDGHDNQSSIKSAIRAIDFQPVSLRMKEVVRKYFAHDRVVVPEASSIDDLILLAMEIYYFYQYMVVLPDEQEREANREELIETVSEEELIETLAEGEVQNHGRVVEKDDFDTLFSEAHEAYKYFQAVRVKSPRDVLDLINADSYFCMQTR